MTIPDATAATDARTVIDEGRSVLGIELGSTRIKACLIDPESQAVLATGSHSWQNSLVNGVWTYDEAEIWAGLQASYAALIADAEARHGTRPRSHLAIGVSAMMHGYLAFDASGELLVPFRTWRNTSTGEAVEALSSRFGLNIPHRWSVAHLYQALLDGEEHLGRLHHLTTLAGLVHERLTGERVLGIGDASGMFPIDDATRDYDARLLREFDGLAEGRLPALQGLLPRVLTAGDDAGRLTAEGAALLDPEGTLEPGAIACPPEGDAGTGMVATGAVAPRTGNVSAGTSMFAMVVLEKPLAAPHEEVDLVTTPAGDAVAMVHCNNGASELDAWSRVFARFAERAGLALSPDEVFGTLFAAAAEGEADAGGVLATNLLSGEPIIGVAAGRPLVMREPAAVLSLENLMRAELYGAFATLSIGMRVLEREGVAIDRLAAHGGMFRTAGVAQRALAAALAAPVSVSASASEGGAWGIAVLAAFAAHRAAGGTETLASYLDEVVFADEDATTITPTAADLDGFGRYLATFERALPVLRAAGGSIHTAD